MGEISLKTIDLGCVQQIVHLQKPASLQGLGKLDVEQESCLHPGYNLDEGQKEESQE